MAGPKIALPAERSITENKHDSTKFAVTVATLAVLYNLLVAVTSHYLSDGPLYVGTSVGLYAWAGTLCSVVGLVGILKKNSTLITSFSHFLLLDTFVSAICRLIVLQFFFDAFYDQNVCSPHHHNPTWSPENFHHDIVTSVQRFREDNMMRSRRKRSCSVELGVLQMVLVGVLVCLTAVQGALAVGMRRHGLETERRKLEERCRDLESAGIMDEKSTIQCLEA